MNIGRLTDNDLREISEQICEHLFSEGASVSDAEFIISELFSELRLLADKRKQKESLMPLLKHSRESSQSLQMLHLSHLQDIEIIRNCKKPGL